MTVIEIMKPLLLTLVTTLLVMGIAFIRSKLRSQKSKDILDSVKQYMLEGMDVA